MPTLRNGSQECTPFRPALTMGAVLVLSGVGHLAWLWWTGAEWSGPISPRKPSLFGISAGVTVWSLVWVVTKLRPVRFDRALASAMGLCLLVEVGLITLQYWRGVPSHFNHATRFDGAVEWGMLGLIVLVTGYIAWLCGRSCWLPPMPAADVVALRAGLWLLLVSCVLGGVITVVGARQAAQGLPVELWGRAGVLKYPHGAALHAIQMLPLLLWLARWCRVKECATLWGQAGLIGSVASSQVLFLLHAMWQTAKGRDRLDVDLVGGSLLAGAGLCLLSPVLVLAWSLPRHVIGRTGAR